MPSLPISTVRQNLFGLVQQVNDDHDPLTVVTKSGTNAVLVAESDWNSMVETLYVLKTHGGAKLLESAQDARDGRTESHSLIDPDEQVADPATSPSAAAEVFDSMSMSLSQIVAQTGELLQSALESVFAPLDLPENLKARIVEQAQNEYYKELPGFVEHYIDAPARREATAFALRRAAAMDVGFGSEEWREARRG